MSDKTTDKPLSKIQEMRRKVMKQKEDTINTVLTTAKNNPSFIKLLMFTLNSLENFVSPPNREIRVNASVIIRLEGVGILHKITIKNIKNDEIVSKAGDIIWKLIGVYNIIDRELAKLFAEKNGHKAVIEILLERKTGDVTVPYVRVLNGLVQIPQLVPTLIESGLANTMNLDDEKDIEKITLNLDTLKNISNQKAGRDFLITKNFVEKIIKNINVCADKKRADSVLCGLAVLDNLCRNEEGKKAVKDAGGIDCLSHVLDLLGNDDYILKMCAKIYSKIANADDMKAQLDLLKQYLDTITTKGPDALNFNDVNKSLVLVSNFMLVDELGKQLQNEENFKVLENLFNEIQKIDLTGKDNNFVNVFTLINKYFMLIFYRLFALQPAVYNKQTDAGKQEAPLLKNIQNSIKKDWEAVKNLNNKESSEIFAQYFTSYAEILGQNFKVMKENKEVDEDFNEVLLYIDNNILANGQNVFNADDLNSHKVASNILKITDELGIHNDKQTKKDEFLKSLVNCYPYLEYLFTTKEDDEILCNSLEVIYDLLNNEKEFFNKNIEQIIFKICDFMNKKSNHRFPCLQCMKLLDIYLTPEYVSGYIKSRDPGKVPTHSIDFVECTVNVMVHKPQNVNFEKIDKSSILVEQQISEIGGVLLEKLIDELEFKKLLKEFCASAESFEPDSKNKDAASSLEKLTKKMFGVMNVKKYYELGSMDILQSLKHLIEKEVKFVEFYKRDKNNQKSENYAKNLEEVSSRVFIELALDLKLCYVSQQNLKYIQHGKALDILFLFLSKSTDNENIKMLLYFFKEIFKFLLDNERNIKLETKEYITEKLTNISTGVLRKLIEEEDVVGVIIDNLTMLAEARKHLCNTMVKAGLPRLLFQVMETSPNEENVEKALYLLKIISFSNLDNLTMVANQNALIKFFDTKNKYPNNQKIIDGCDLISNEILAKIPNQEKYLDELIKDAVKQFNENAKADFASPDVKQKLLNNLEVVNSFSTNKTQFENLSKEEEFINNLKAVSDKTFAETNVTNVIEKLLNNELSLLKKLNTVDAFEHAFTIDKLINVIKNKGGYRDVLLSATEEFLKYLKDDDLYNKFLKEKIDNSFIDSIFDNIENYLGDIKVSKDLNNILCYLCLRDEKLASYIKSKGGLANVLEELKSNVNSNDKNSQQMKLNALKMLNSLCKDKEGMDMFVKANGLDLINKILEIDADMYEDYKPNDKDLYKTREPINLPSEEKKQEEENAGESYVVYCAKLIQNAIEQGHADFNNPKSIKNLLVISEAEYPKKEVFVEICNLYNKVNYQLPAEEKYVYFLIKQCLSFRGKYNVNENLVSEIDKTAEKVLPKLKDNNAYLDEVKKSVGDNVNDQLQLTYLSSYVSLNDNFAQSYVPIVDNLAKFANDFYGYYIEKTVSKTREDVPEGVIISLSELLLYLLKNKKETVQPKIDQIIDSLIFLGEQYANRRGHFAFSLLYLTKLAQIFDIIGKRTDDNKLNVLYKKYLDSVVPRAVPIFGLAHKYLKEANLDYSKLDKNLVGLYEINSKNINDYFSSPESANQTYKPDDLVNNILALLNDLQNATGIEPEKLNDQFETLFSILNGLLSQVDNKSLYVSNDQCLLKILSAMKTTKEKGFPNKNGICEKIMNNLAKNLENSSEIFEKITDFIGEDLKASPQKEVDINLDTLAHQTKYSTAVKCLLNNKDLTKNIHELYKADNLPIERRKNISTIYNNLMKNTYNVDTILEEDPETFKTIAEKLSKKENVIKDKENIEIPKNELGIIVSVLKDNNNYKQVMAKKLITDADVKNILENYKGVDPSLEENLKELKSIYDRMQNKDLELQKSANFKVDFAILNNLKKRIEQAFNEHIDAVQKLNPLFEAEENKPEESGEKPKLTKQLGFVRKITTAPAGANVAQVASSIKKRRLSIISAHLFYNPFNTQLVSPISTKNKDDIATALDSLLALIRLLYSNHKDSSDTTIKEQRQHLLQEAIKTLKMLSICPDNHKPICELGLLNFMERLISDNREENFAIYLGCLDILKNCTWSESAVLLLLESPVLDKLIEEILNFYNKPELLTQSDELRSCFLYENILFSNICKCNKGFETFFNKIGMEKLIVLGKNTGNIDFLTAIVEMLTNYLLVKKPEFTDEQLNDILEICHKGLTLPDKSQNLLAKTLGLTGFIYDDKSKEKINKMNIVKIINDTWEEFKDEPEYFHNVILLLGTICLDCKLYSNEVVDIGLLDKIITKLMAIEQNDELIINYSIFLKNLVEKNEDNRSKMCKEEVFNNILHFIDTYSPKIVARRRGFSITGTIMASGTITSRGGSMSFDPSSLPPKREESYNIILNNLLRVLDLLTLGDKCVDLITKNRFMGAIIDTISKPACDIKVVIASLQCLANYFYKDTKSKWKHYEIEQLYSILKLLQKEFYANGEVLSKINYIAGYILKGYKSKLYSERYYLLALEGLNCQDWNVDLVILTLKILKEALEDHEDLHNDIFEQTKQSILNILRVYQNNLEIQKLCYEILTIFAHNKVFSFNIVLKTDVMEIVRDTLNNQDFNTDTEKRLVIRIAVFNLLNYLVYDDSTSVKVAYELMESFIKDLLSPNFTEDLTSISGLLANLFRTKQSIEPFYQYSGQEALCLCLEKFYTEKKFILNCFKMIKEICFGGEENKKKLREIKVEDKIKVAMEKCKPEDRIIKFEGKITITNINFEPGQNKKPYSEPNYDEIHCIELTKRAVYNSVTNGFSVKAIDPKSKIKDFNLCFAPDLMKVYLKKPKLVLIPPKAKYTLEVPSTVLVRGHGTDAFKKTGGVLKKAPDQKLCFSLIMKNADGSDAKSLNVICANEKDCEKISECVEVALYYAKTRCGKAESGNLFPHLKFLSSLEDEKPKKLFGKK